MNIFWFQVDSVGALVSRDFEDLELRRGGAGAGAGAGHGASAAAGTKSRIPNRPPKSKSPTKSKSKPKKSKKAKHAKECKDGNEPIASRELEELVERGGSIGKLAHHLSCPGEEHHARELLEELVIRSRTLEARDFEEAGVYESRDFEDVNGYEARDFEGFDGYEARELDDFEDLV
jgi:hypothetical protein